MYDIENVEFDLAFDTDASTAAEDISSDGMGYACVGIASFALGAGLLTYGFNDPDVNPGYSGFGTGFTTIGVGLIGMSYLHDK